MQQTSFEDLSGLAGRIAGQAIPREKAYLIEARLAPLARREGFADIDELAACLKARPNPGFEREIAAALTGKQTGFFRDRAQLEDIAARLLPDMAQKTSAPRLRVWCAGGASGQEAFSLAMLLAEQGEALGETRVEILSTDLSMAMTQRGRDGLFGHFEVQRGLSVHRLLDHFDRLEDGQWLISDRLRQAVSFRQHNLLEDASGLGEFDLILCRNVLGEMSREAGARTLVNLSRQLTPSGLLCLEAGARAEGLVTGLEPARDARGALCRAPGSDPVTVAA